MFYFNFTDATHMLVVRVMPRLFLWPVMAAFTTVLSSMSCSMLLDSTMSKPAVTVTVTSKSSGTTSKMVFVQYKNTKLNPVRFLNGTNGESFVCFLDMKYNFNKINTLNQGTPYDYTSVMQYERCVTSL